ncbi:MAG: DUF4258 domain-containing protein [Chloroflexota bacterium]|nr:MAG: DUF4258 domain-containing protein [Chloroflexota bacterium]
MSLSVRLTHHARTRQAQRNVSDDDVAFVLDHGRGIRSGGALHVFLGRRDMPKEPELYRRYAHLEGVVLVLDDTGDAPVLLTVYRNRGGLKAIRAKAKHRRTPLRRYGRPDRLPADERRAA